VRAVTVALAAWEAAAHSQATVGMVGTVVVVVSAKMATP
jgi:hypothetical protein